jgi:hypothetical protein
MNTLGASGISNLSTAKHWLSVWREILLLKIAGAAGFFVCFFPGSMPLRRLRLWVYLPATLGVALPFLFVSAVSLAMRTGANPCGNGDIFALSGTSRFAWNAGPGLHFSVLGLVCIAFAVSRISRAWPCFPFISRRRPFRRRCSPAADGSDAGDAVAHDDGGGMIGKNRCGCPDSLGEP